MKHHRRKTKSSESLSASSPSLRMLMDMVSSSSKDDGFEDALLSKCATCSDILPSWMLNMAGGEATHTARVISHHVSNEAWAEDKVNTHFHILNHVRRW